MRKRFDGLTVVTGECIIRKRSVVVTMDVTSLDKIGGLLLCRSRKQNLYWRYTESECTADYEISVRTLIAIGYDIQGFVVDGKPGIIKMLRREHPDVPCQYCQFHQIKTIKQYIPRRAKSGAARSLRRLSLKITSYWHWQFETALQVWYVLYRDFLNEKTWIDNPQEKRKWRYTHEKLRSAFNSLRRNLPYLYTYQKHPDKNIPNTTNACDGFFSNLKERLKRHRGLSPKRKKKMTDYLLENWDE
jgi:hypothetical protein